MSSAGGLSHDDYTVGWICALPLEMTAAKAMLDETHPELPQSSHDHNSYALGKVGGHNVAVASLPSGVYGTTSAAVVAAHMLSTFPCIRFGLMVGIGGGVPSSQNDIRLGDVVASNPTGNLPGVVQYDYGKTIASGRFERTGTRNLPPQILLTALSNVRSDHLGGKIDFHEHLFYGIQNIGQSGFFYPGQEKDHLFEAAYDHEYAGDCSDCDLTQLVSRQPRTYNTPEVYYGNIASGNQVMKHGRTRDNLAKELGILCFEMEAAGLMDHFPCMVIRGICDYCDSHKHKDWQGYAALTAAAYAKELLSKTPVAEPNCTEDLNSSFAVRFKTLRMSPSSCFVGRDQELLKMHKSLQASSSSGGTIVLHGPGGIGKTQLATAYAMRHRNEYSAVFWFNAMGASSLQSSFLEAAKRILLDHPHLKDLRKAVDDDNALEAAKAVKRWLSRPRNDTWLLIFDAHDTPAIPKYDDSRAFDLKSFLPEARQGHIIITTITSHVYLGNSIKITPLGSEVALGVISQTSGREGLHDDPYARELIKEMGGLPLALASAGTYLRQVAMSIRDYLELHKSSWAELQNRAPRLPSYDKALYSTWELSFRQIRRINDNSEDLLYRWAFLSHQDLWFELLCPDRSTHSWRSNPLEFHEAMRVICDYGLAEITPQLEDMEVAGGYRMHKGVHSWIRNYHPFDQEYSQILGRLAVSTVCLYSHNMLSEFKHSRYFRRLLPHADKCYELLLDELISRDLSHSALMLYLSALAQVYNKASHRISRYYTFWLDSIGMDYEEKHNLTKEEELYELLLRQVYEMDTRNYYYYAVAIDGLSSIYSRTRRFSEERRMYRLLLKIPDENRRRSDSNIKALVRYSYITEAELPCMLAFTGVNAFVLTLWTWEFWTVSESLFEIYSVAAPLLIQWGHFSHRIQPWKAVVLFILYIVLCELWLTQLGGNEVPIFIKVIVYWVAFSPMVRPLYYEGLF